VIPFLKKAVRATPKFGPMTVFLQIAPCSWSYHAALAHSNARFVGAAAAALRLPTLQGLNTGKRKG